MTANDIDAIRKLTDAATLGPWTPHTTYPHTVWQGSMYDEDPGMISTTLAHEVVADAEFIAAARTLVPALCDEIEQLREQLFAQKPVVDAAEAWAEMCEDGGLAPDDCRKTEDALHDAVEQYRLMDHALTTARAEQPEVPR